MSEIKKVIIPLGGIGTRFLPLSKVMPKELWPLVDLPIIQYIIQEARASGINHLIFVVKPGQKWIAEYFKRDAALEKLLKNKKKENSLEGLSQLNDLIKDVTLSFALQKSPLGDGHAILQTRRIAAKEPCAVLFSDDIVVSKTPCLAQLIQTFKTCQRPIVALKQVPQRSLSKYGTVQIEKIASRLYKIKRIVEKPDPASAPSNLVIVGKYIITPDVFEYLSETEPNLKGEIILAEALNKMIADGKVVYGYEFEGEWLECADKFEWLKSNLWLALRHPEYGKELREQLKI